MRTYSVRTEPVQDVPVRTAESQYPLLSEAGPPDDTKDRCRVDSIVVGYNYVLGAKLCVRRYVGFHPLKNSEENLEKDSPHVLFVFAWYAGLHCIRPEIVVQLVNTEKGFVWFPTIACLSLICPTDSEFHSGALVNGCVLI